MRKFIVIFTCFLANNALATEPDYVSSMNETRVFFETYQQSKNVLTRGQVIREAQKTRSLLYEKADFFEEEGRRLSEEYFLCLQEQRQTCSEEELLKLEADYHSFLVVGAAIESEINDMAAVVNQRW